MEFTFLQAYFLDTAYYFIQVDERQCLHFFFLKIVPYLKYSTPTSISCCFSIYYIILFAFLLIFYYFHYKKSSAASLNLYYKKAYYKHFLYCLLKDSSAIFALIPSHNNYRMFEKLLLFMISY